MIVIVAGSRTINNYDLVAKSIKDAIENHNFIITEVVSGTARGVDKLGELWACQSGIPIKKFPAEWRKYGRSAGFKRNKQMAEYADALIAITNGSAGTKNMIQTAKKLQLKVLVYEDTRR